MEGLGVCSLCAEPWRDATLSCHDQFVCFVGLLDHSPFGFQSYVIVGPILSWKS